MRGEIAGICTAVTPRSAGFQGLEALDFPLAARGPAGRSLQPGLRAAAHVAGKEIAAWQAAFAVSGGERGDVAADASLRILPRHAIGLGAVAERICGGSPRVGE